MALRSTRARREADEAGDVHDINHFTSSAELALDKDYRKAVHWLETLRIRRIKTLEGGYNVSRTLCCRSDPMNVICVESTTLRFRGHGSYQECARHVYRYFDVSATRACRCVS